MYNVITLRNSEDVGPGTLEEAPTSPKPLSTKTPPHPAVPMLIHQCAAHGDIVPNGQERQSAEGQEGRGC
nr:uncharacterized protein CI109_000957 [Kwoniella shandongensis]KAA5530777.1 hypothetical protein CI109_000957 [Kwoniella shandongensis]